MSSRLRTESKARISFFAFQDIIASVTGVMILVTLIMASHLETATDAVTDETTVISQRRLAALLEEQTRLELDSRTLTESLAVAQTQPDAAKLQEDVAALNTQIENEQRRFESTKTQSERQREESRQRDATLGLTSLREQTDKARTDAVAITEKDRIARIEKEGVWKDMAAGSIDRANPAHKSVRGWSWRTGKTPART